MAPVLFMGMGTLKPVFFLPSANPIGLFLIQSPILTRAQ